VDPVEHVADAPFTALALTEVWGGYAEGGGGASWWLGPLPTAAAV